MPDIKTIPWKELMQLSSIGVHIRYGYNNPTGACKQKWARKALEKTYAKKIAAFSPEVRNYFSPETSDADLFAFLYACGDEVSLRYREYRTPQALILEPFGVEVQSAMAELYDADCGIAIQHLPNGQVALVVEDSAIRLRRVILENAVLTPECVNWDYCNDPLEVQKEGEQYILRTCAYDDSVEVFRFTHAHVELTSYNCAYGECYWSNPWEHLCALAWSIISRENMPGDQCNDREKALLPLLQEFRQFCMEKQDVSYPLLTQLAREVGCDPQKLEKRRRKKKEKTYFQIDRALNQPEWEPLWREIYRKIVESQEGYPTRVEARCKAENLQKTRSALENYFHSQGFTGSYPDFVKTGDIQGLHLIESYEIPYFVCREKDATMHIHCVETLGYQDGLAVQFLCGEALKKKGRAPADLVSCLFNHKGRRYFHWVRDFGSRYSEEIQPLERTLQFAAIAVKTLQMEKLTKEERERYDFGSSESVLFFLPLFFLLGGALFGAVMTGAMWLLGALVIILMGHGSEAIPVLSGVAWGRMFAFCALGFSVPMCIITILTKRS